MKAEHVGSRFQVDPISIFEEGRTPAEILSRFEQFHFPQHEFSSPLAREKEIEIHRRCDYRSSYIVSLSPVDGETILAAARIIAKRSVDEKLPIEYARVTDLLDDPTADPLQLKVGENFSIPGNEKVIPACEIGSLRAADSDPEKGITMRMRHAALDAVVATCGTEVHRRGFHSFFLTCVGTPGLRRLYRENCFFKEAAMITYGSTPLVALWRYPGTLPKNCPGTTYRPGQPVIN
jgi:hypothetical protein